jgi:flagellar biosynthesis GTPase FlhF
MEEGYIYLIWEEQFIKSKENIFKLGKSKEIFCRMNGYPKGSKLLFTTICTNVDDVEKQLLIIFKEKYGLYNAENYENSRERFNVKNYYSIINDIISYLNLFNNNMDLVVTTQSKEEQKLIIENNKKQKEEEKKQKEEEKKQKEEEKKQKEEEKKQKEEEKKQKEEENKKQKEEEKKQKEEKKKQEEEKNQKEEEKKKQSSDCITGFIMDKIIKDSSGSIGKRHLIDVFKEWFQMNYGNRKPPKLSEIEETMIKRFGNRNTKTNKWMGIKFSEEEYQDDVDYQDNIANVVI